MTELVRSLREYTQARIGLGSAGQSLSTVEALRLARDHALARDAVHAPFAVDALETGARSLGHPAVIVRSRAHDRSTYLRRPDLGRQLHPEDLGSLSRLAKRPVAVVVADGLAPQAPGRHALPVLRELAARRPDLWSGIPVVFAHQGRVALGDEIGGALQVRLVLVLLGERPGLSSPDSLGAYLTHGPKVGRTDAERNCVSNIRPEGLGYAAAAHAIDRLAKASLALGLSGVALKDDSVSEFGSADDGARLPIVSSTANIAS